MSPATVLGRAESKRPYPIGKTVLNRGREKPREPNDPAPGATPLIAAAVAASLAFGAPFNCTPVAVYDGDGPIWCAEGPRIRLAGIAAQELDETCRPGHPCPAGSGAARDALARLPGVHAAAWRPASSRQMPPPSTATTSHAPCHSNRPRTLCRVPSGIGAPLGRPSPGPRRASCAAPSIRLEPRIHSEEALGDRAAPRPTAGFRTRAACPDYPALPRHAAV